MSVLQALVMSIAASQHAFKNSSKTETNKPVSRQLVKNLGPDELHDFFIDYHRQKLRSCNFEDDDSDDDDEVESAAAETIDVADQTVDEGKKTEEPPNDTKLVMQVDFQSWQINLILVLSKTCMLYSVKSSFTL